MKIQSFKSILADHKARVRLGESPTEVKASTLRQLTESHKRYAHSSRTAATRKRRKVKARSEQLREILADMYGLTNAEAKILITKDGRIQRGATQCIVYRARQLFAQRAYARGIEQEAISGFLGRTRTALFYPEGGAEMATTDQLKPLLRAYFNARKKELQNN